MGGTLASPHPAYVEDFIDEVLVECPSCGRPALVVARAGLRAQSPAVRCASCGFSRTGWPVRPGVLVNAVARRRCPRCGQWLQKQHQRVLAKRREVVLSCPCKAQTTVAYHYEAIRLGEPYDPYYGYVLWLRKTVGRNVLWAYNRRHLAFISDFVKAPLRPRTPGFNASLVSRLPAWIAKGTRRAAILRALRSMQRRSA